MRASSAVAPPNVELRSNATSGSNAPASRTASCWAGTLAQSFIERAKSASASAGEGTFAMEARVERRRNLDAQRPVAKKVYFDGFMTS
jgi:hypothetical protein